MFQNKNLSVLGSNLLLKGLDESVVTSVFNSKNFRAEKEGELIFQAGDESNFLYLILQGEVKLKYSGTKGSNASFRRVKNEFFGEQEVIEKTPRISSAVADTDCIFYLISKEELFQLISKNKAILKNLSFIPQDEDYEEENSVLEPQQQNQSDPVKNEEDKIVEEIIMDEDLADYSFDTPANEELHDFHDENYLSYDQNNNEEDLNFNNGFDPEKKHYENNFPEENQADNLQNEETTDKLTDFPRLYLENNDSKESELVPAINDFEHIPVEPEKFAFRETSVLNLQEKTYREDHRETETSSLIEGTSKFINNNLLFPLNEIKKLADLLNKCSSLPEASQINDLIKRHADSVQSIVDSTLEFLSGKNNKNLTRQNIKLVLNKILNLLSEYVETRNVNLYKKIDTEVEVYINDLMLYNAFFQLAKNACESMPDGGNIFVTAAKDDDKVKIEFIDEGKGIPSSLTFEVFEPMVSHGKQDATGLGLSIAKKIFRDHNGDITVDGELGEGTRIIVTLPVSAY